MLLIPQEGNPGFFPLYLKSPQSYLHEQFLQPLFVAAAHPPGHPQVIWSGGNGVATGGIQKKRGKILQKWVTALNDHWVSISYLIQVIKGDPRGKGKYRNMTDAKKSFQTFF